MQLFLTRWMVLLGHRAIRCLLLHYYNILLPTKYSARRITFPMPELEDDMKDIFVAPDLSQESPLLLCSVRLL